MHVLDVGGCSAAAKRVGPNGSPCWAPLSLDSRVGLPILEVHPRREPRRYPADLGPERRPVHAIERVLKVEHRYYDVRLSAVPSDILPHGVDDGLRAIPGADANL